MCAFSSHRTYVHPYTYLRRLDVAYVASSHYALARARCAIFAVCPPQPTKSVCVCVCAVAVCVRTCARAQHSSHRARMRFSLILLDPECNQPIIITCTRGSPAHPASQRCARLVRKITLALVQRARSPHIISAHGVRRTGHRESPGIYVQTCSSRSCRPTHTHTPARTG